MRRDTVLPGGDGERRAGGGMGRENRQGGVGVAYLRTSHAAVAIALLVAVGPAAVVESRPRYFNCGPWTAGGSLPSSMGSPTYNEATANECESSPRV